MFLSGVQTQSRLDSRLKHAGMTDFEKDITLMQQAGGNRPTGIEDLAYKFVQVIATFVVRRSHL